MRWFAAEDSCRTFSNTTRGALKAKQLSTIFVLEMRVVVKCPFEEKARTPIAYRCADATGHHAGRFVRGVLAATPTCKEDRLLPKIHRPAPHPLDRILDLLTSRHHIRIADKAKESSELNQGSEL